MKFLTVMEELAYRRILDLLYTEGGELPDDDDAMAEQTRTFADWPAVKGGLVRKRKITVADGWITNAKCTEVLTAIAEKSAKAAESGKASGRVRRVLLTKNERTLNDRSTDAPTNGATDDKLSQLVSKSVRETTVSLTGRESERVPEVTITFEDFRRPYPKFDGLNAARADWDAAIKAGADPQSILEGLARWSAEWERRIADPKREFRPEHIPNAGKWLRGKGWLDPTPEMSGGTVTLISRRWPPDDPCGIRAAVVAEAGDGAAVSLIDPATWVGPKTIETRTGLAAERLKKLNCIKPFIVRKAG
jgi:uncharacterized protein YdaU (DUF1376 family)